MALKQTFTDARGFTSETAYHRVEAISGDKRRLVMQVRIYKDQAANAAPMGEFTKEFVPASDDRWDAQAYAHLKTLPEYAGAEDC